MAGNVGVEGANQNQAPNFVFSMASFCLYSVFLETRANAKASLPPPKEDSVVHGCLSEFAKRTHDILFRSLKGLVCSRV